MPFASSNAAHIHYEVAGRGPGLVMVHGIGGDAERVFGTVAPHFTNTHTVIRPNLSGSGPTRDDGMDLNIDLIVDQIAAVTRDAVEGPADMLGFSLGAVAVATLAATHPALVRRLVLMGGWTNSTGARDRFYFETWQKMLDTDRELFKRFSTLTGFSSAALDRIGREGLARSLADDWPPDGIDRQIDLGSRVDIRERLATVTAPTLVIGFADDNMIPIDGSRQLQSAIPGSRLLEVEGEGHMDWFVDSGPLVELIREFIDSTAGRTA